jgi:hypothetical protein
MAENHLAAANRLFKQTEPALYKRKRRSIMLLEEAVRFDELTLEPGPAVLFGVPMEAPACGGVASSHRFDIWGLRREKPRRRPAVSDNMRGQAKYPSWSWLIRNSQLRRPLSFTQAPVSYLSEPGLLATEPRIVYHCGSNID